jgi:ACS family hexuronate transporter-like MFS transporter
LGQAGNWPGGVKAVSEWFPPKERAFAIGFWNSGSTFGAVFAPPLVAWIALRWGWRSAFFVTGALGFVWVVAWLAVYGKPVRAWEETSSRKKIRWRDLFRFKQVWGLVLARMLADPVWWFYVFWLPEYLKRERDFSLAMIGFFAWIPFLAAAMGSLSGGLLSSLLARRKPLLWSRKAVMAVSAVFMMAGIPAVLVEHAGVALALISLATFAYSTWAANILTLPADLFPHEVVASVSGLSGTGAALGGMAFMLIIGAVVDRFSYVPVFTAAGVMPLIAAGFILWKVREIQAT